MKQQTSQGINFEKIGSIYQPVDLAQGLAFKAENPKSDIFIFTTEGTHQAYLHKQPVAFGSRYALVTQQKSPDNSLLLDIIDDSNLEKALEGWFRAEKRGSVNGISIAPFETYERTATREPKHVLYAQSISITRNVTSLKIYHGTPEHNRLSHTRATTFEVYGKHPKNKASDEEN